MGLLRRIAEERRRGILAHAAPKLEEGEEVLHWVRARKIEGRGQGFVFITAHRVVITWPGRDADAVTMRWGEIDEWGVNPKSRGGPVLSIRADGKQTHVRMPVTTSGMAQNVSNFLRRFASQAPTARRDLTPKVESHDRHVHVAPERKSLADKTRRILITVLGAVLMIGGFLMVPLPGPWSFPVIIGGLAVLATEYDWAEDALQWARHKYRTAVARLKKRREAKRGAAASRRTGNER